MSILREMVPKYMILFSMYVGMELQKDQDIREQILNDDPELINSAITGWVSDYVFHGAVGDPEAFCKEKFNEYVAANYPPWDTRYDYLAIGTDGDEHHDGKEWIVDIFDNQDDATKCCEDLQQLEDRLFETNSLLKNRVTYFVRPWLVRSQYGGRKKSDVHK